MMKAVNYSSSSNYLGQFIFTTLLSYSFLYCSSSFVQSFTLSTFPTSFHQADIASRSSRTNYSYLSSRQQRLVTSSHHPSSASSQSSTSSSSSSSLHAINYIYDDKTNKPIITSKNRQKILNRNGSYFNLNRFAGKIEFGLTTTLVTKLVQDKSSRDSINEWMSDEKRIANSIWTDDLITDLGQSVYRLQLMALQFVTIKLAPHVDTLMWIEPSSSSSSNDPSSPIVPVFKLQSVDFDPNIQLLPGLPNITPESLGIEIEVVGELQPSTDGKGVFGRIGFCSGGDLPPPMRLLPESVLRGAGSIICNTVGRFVVKGFEKGALKSFQEFNSRVEEHGGGN